MQTVEYKSYRDQIQSGDLLIWKESNVSIVSNCLLKIIRLLTRSKYGHVGIAFILAHRLLVIEATFPYIHFVPVSQKETFYHIAMGIEWKDEYSYFLLDKLGFAYSIMDGIRALRGRVTEKDDNYQCAELCHDFYLLTGEDYGNNYTPSQLVNAILEKGNKTLVWVKCS